MACEYCSECGALVDLDFNDGQYVKDKYYCENCYVDEWICGDCGIELSEQGNGLCDECARLY